MEVQPELFIANIILPGTQTLTKHHIKQIRLTMDLLGQQHGQKYKTLSQVLPQLEDGTELFNLSYEIDAYLETNQCYIDIMDLISDNHMDVMNICSFLEQFLHWLASLASVTEFMECNFYNYAQRAILSQLSQLYQLNNSISEPIFLQQFILSIDQFDFGSLYVKTQVDFNHEHFVVIGNYIQKHCKASIPSVYFFHLIRQKYFPFTTLSHYIEQTKKRSQAFLQLSLPFKQTNQQVLQSSIEILDLLDKPKIVDQMNLKLATKTKQNSNLTFDLDQDTKPSFATASHGSEQVRLEEVTDPNIEITSSFSYDLDNKLINLVNDLTFEEKVTSLIDGLKSTIITRRHVMIIKMLAELIGTPILESMQIEQLHKYILTDQNEDINQISMLVLGYCNKNQMLSGLYRIRARLSKSNKDSGSSILDVAGIQTEKLSGYVNFDSDSACLNQNVDSFERRKCILLDIYQSYMFKYDIDLGNMFDHLHTAIQLKQQLNYYLENLIFNRIAIVVPSIRDLLNYQQLPSEVLNAFVRQQLFIKHRVQESHFSILSKLDEYKDSSPITSMLHPINTLFHQKNLQILFEQLNYMINIDQKDHGISSCKNAYGQSFIVTKTSDFANKRRDLEAISCFSLPTKTKPRPINKFLK